MNKRITVDLTKGSIMQAIRDINDLIREIEEDNVALVSRLAADGEAEASAGFGSVTDYIGDSSVSVTHEISSSGTNPVATITAAGSGVGFIEFGAGATHGYGHEMAGELGFGPGTYPEGRRQNKNYANWENPSGWYVPGGRHTFGNAPTAAMYKARVKIEDEIGSVAREVFHD